MKTFKIALTAVFILAILAVQAKAQEYRGSRLIIGMDKGLVQPVFFIPPVPRPVFPHQSGIICRDYIVTEGRHGNFREVTKTVCRDRHGRHIDRHQWRGDDRRHWRDDRWHDDRRGHGGGRNRW